MLPAVAVAVSVNSQLNASLLLVSSASAAHLHYAASVSALFYDNIAMYCICSSVPGGLLAPCIGTLQCNHLGVQQQTKPHTTPHKHNTTRFHHTEIYANIVSIVCNCLQAADHLPSVSNCSHHGCFSTGNPGYLLQVQLAYDRPRLSLPMARHGRHTHACGWGCGGYGDVGALGTQGPVARLPAWMGPAQEPPRA